VSDQNERPTRRNPLPALIVTGVAALVILASSLLPTGGGADTEGAVFPGQVASYSWWTAGLRGSEVDAAVVVYQNGVGVEFMDFPQAVLIGTDGSTYRRLGAAEGRSFPENQGDPAASVLSADGTFVVIAGSSRKGSVEVLRLSDGQSRSITIDDGRSAIPASITADGRSVLLLTSDDTLTPYEDMNFRLHADLALLDLETGELRDFAELAGTNSAAISPDGSRIVADTDDGVVLIDVADGRVTSTDIDAGYAQLDGDAWAPDGESFAFQLGHALHVLDVSGAEPVERTVRLPGVDYGVAIGWRDDSTALVYAGDDSGENRAWFYWADTGSGELERISSYTPDFTGASLSSADVARDLVPDMRVEDRVPERGGPPLWLLLPLALVPGLVVWLLTPKRAKRVA
jgi:hypothetical protein